MVVLYVGCRVCDSVTRRRRRSKNKNKEEEEKEEAEEEEEEEDEEEAIQRCHDGLAKSSFENSNRLGFIFHIYTLQLHLTL